MLDLLEELKNVVDMTPKAITERLRLVSQLTVLCLALGKARPAGSRPDVDAGPKGGDRHHARG